MVKLSVVTTACARLNPARTVLLTLFHCLKGLFTCKVYWGHKFLKVNRIQEWQIIAQVKTSIDYATAKHYFYRIVYLSKTQKKTQKSYTLHHIMVRQTTQLLAGH